MSISSAEEARLRPSGTITFLFTDIEGSTQRWEESPEEMRAALGRHDALLREVIEGRGGFVFKTVGDAFCAAFADAAAAVDAALDAQRALHSENSWSQIGELRVRMALHTGEVQEQGGDYFGPPVNRVARILSAGHGGQILISMATEEQLRARLPEQVELREMGTHRLKDITLPERLYQIVVPDLPDEFPALKTLDNHPNNLPLQPSPLVGREREIAEVREHLLSGRVRLVTLTGMGGIGKTRLSLGVAAEVVEEFRDGAFFVELASIADPALVVPTIAQALGLREERGKPLLQTVQEYLRDKEMLLVLDNFEQVGPAAPQVAELLRSAPQVKALTSSREVLHVSMEQEYPVPPLSVPDPERLPPIERLPDYEAVALFVGRAQASKPAFELDHENAEAVVRICARLDGLPLALELAAARMKLLSPEAMLKRLDSRLKLLTGGARDLPARQQTLRNAIEWSYELLSPAERQLFARLAVFVGGRALEAVEAVCNTRGDLELDPFDGIASLVDKSLLAQRDAPDGEPRFLMLETIREYALEKLEESGEADALRGWYAGYFLGLAEEAEPELTGKRQAEWLQRLESEHDNFRAVLDRCLAGATEVEQGVRLGGALWWFWWMHGHLSEGRHWLLRALERSGEQEEMVGLRAKILRGLGMLTLSQGDFASARPFFERSLECYRETGDRRGAASALNNLGNVAHFQGDFPTARLLYTESLALYREVGDKRGTASALSLLGAVTHEQGDFETARALLEESLVVIRELGDKRGMASALNNLGLMYRYRGEHAEARARLEESLALLRELGDRWAIANSLNNLGAVSHLQGDLPTARALLCEGLELLQDLGDKRGTAECLEGLAGVAGDAAEPERTAVLCAAAETLRQSIGSPLPPSERSCYESAVERARSGLDEMALQTAWDRGRSMTLGEVVAYALGR